MLQALQSYLPLVWQRTVEFLGTPLWWIPVWQRQVLDQHPVTTLTSPVP